MNKLVNVLILTHIGLICLMLLVPAIMKLRAESDRVRCAVSLTQINMALHNYAGGRSGRLPPGIDFLDPKIPLERRFSWLVLLEPYVKSSPLYKQLREAKTWDDPEIRHLVIDSHPVHVCPGNPRRRLPTHEWATHYIGVAGIGPDAAMLAKDDPRAGAFGYERSLNIEKVDGTSNLIVLAETATDNGPWVAGGPPTVRGIDLDKPPYFGPVGQFSTKHGRVSNVVFLDNSVRAMSGSVEPHIIERMATISRKPYLPSDDDQQKDN